MPCCPACTVCYRHRTAQCIVFILCGVTAYIRLLSQLSHLVITECPAVSCCVCDAADPAALPVILICRLSAHRISDRGNTVQRIIFICGHGQGIFHAARLRFQQVACRIVGIVHHPCSPVLPRCLQLYLHQTVIAVIPVHGYCPCRGDLFRQVACRIIAQPCLIPLLVGHFLRLSDRVIYD